MLDDCKRPMALLASLLLLTVFLMPPAVAEDAALIDYAASVRLDAQSETARQEVTVRIFVDGDTTHFNVPETVRPDGVLKARYIAINTPESTGRIEEWGKKASRFTQEKLQNADSIFIESDTDSWNLDSTSTRDLVWVWYRPAGEASYRNLNIELLQEGLALPNNAGGNRYGQACLSAAAQARANRLHIYSGEKDPDFFYGDAIELTLRELRLHPEIYEGKKVAFNGIVTVNHSNAVFIEDFDEESGLYFGITAYYGFNLSGGGMEVLHIGNEVRIVGTMQYYEAGHAWQVSGLNYRMMKPKDPGNIQKLSEGHEPSWQVITPEQFNSTVRIASEEESADYAFAELAQGTTVSIAGLPVVGIKAYAQDSSRSGAHLLHCGFDEKVWIWVPPLYDDAGRLLNPDDFTDTVIDASGVVVYDDSVNGFVIRVFTSDGVTIHHYEEGEKAS